MGSELEWFKCQYQWIVKKENPLGRKDVMLQKQNNKFLVEV